MRKFSTSVTMMFREFDVADRFAQAKAAGFDAVEIQILEAGPDVVGPAAAGADVQVLLLNVGMGDLLTGGPGLSGVPGRESDFAAALDQTISVAGALKTPFVHLGPSRVPEGVSRDDCLACYRDNVSRAIDACAAENIRLLIEPMNRVEMPDALIGSPAEAADFITAQVPGQVGLQFDIYHTAMGGFDVVQSFDDHKQLIDHVQFSDVPGRHQPGTGSLDFVALFDGIEAAGYDGWWGAEYMPDGPTLDSFGWRDSLSGAGR